MERPVFLPFGNSPPVESDGWRQRQNLGMNRQKPVRDQDGCPAGRAEMTGEPTGISRNNPPTRCEPDAAGWVPYGPCVAYRDDGSVLLEITCDRGVAYGPYRDYWSSGRVSPEGPIRGRRTRRQVSRLDWHRGDLLGSRHRQAAAGAAVRRRPRIKFRQETVERRRSSAGARTASRLPLRAVPT